MKWGFCRIEARSIALVPLLALAAGVSPRSNHLETLKVAVISCPTAIAGSRAPDAVLYEGNAEVTQLTLTQSTEEEYEGQSQIAPGHYSLIVEAGSCYANTDVTVVAGHARSVGVILQPGRSHYDAHAFVAGTLPLGSISRAYLSRDMGSVAFPLTIDNNVYYGQHLLDGEYTLVLVFGDQDLECRLPVTVRGDGTIYNVSARDVLRSVGYQARYFGKPPQFLPLWPNEHD